MRRFRYFVAVVEHGSFSRAAAALRIAQSALSRHVSELEHEIGAPLLERSPQGVRMTPVGRVFFDDSRAALAQVDNALRQARLAAAGSVGSLVIGINDLAMRHPVVLAALAEFRRDRPQVDLRIRTMPSTDQMRALEAGTINVAFVIERTSGLRIVKHLCIDHDAFVIALPRQHALADRRAITVDDLVDEVFVSVSPERHWLSQSRLLAHCHTSGLAPRSVVQVDSEFLQLGLIAQGVGIGFVNQSAAATLPPGVELRTLAGFKVALDLDLVWLGTNTDGLTSEFCNTVRRHHVAANG